MSAINVTRKENVALIGLDNPPVNAISTALRKELVAAVQELDKDPAIKAIALYGQGKGFCAGADISEFGRPQESPLPPDVTLCIEDCNTPTVSVIHEMALGGGLEIGLASHARVATSDARLGFPEVSIGLIPGAGGCIRMPFLVGWDAAFDLIISGRHLKAAEALTLGLIDKIVDGESKQIALEAAKDIVAGKLPARRTTDLPLEADESVIARWNEDVRRKTPLLLAPARALEAIGCATMPRNQALEREKEIFAECMSGPQSQSFVHGFFAERAVWKIPEAKSSPRPFEKIGIIGGGTMGSGIATSALLAGLEVVLIEQNAQGCERAQNVIASNLGGAVKRGKISEEKKTAMLDQQLKTGTEFQALSDSDLIIEAVFEDMTVEKDVFSKLDAVAKPGTILASNTSCLDLNEIANSTSRPQDVIGLHFFSPAHIMKLLEVVVGEATAPDVTATGFALAKKLRKIAVRSGVCEGFIGNRILYHYLDAADRLVLEGASPYDVDQAMEAFGFALGPFAVNDLAGMDISIATREKDSAAFPSLEQRMLEAKLLGRKSGAGYYVYEGRNKSPNPDLQALLDDTRRDAGLTQRKFSPDEITDRILTAMISEAVKVLEEGIALRPVDVDAVYLFGYGFPRFRGGPMHYADTVGAQTLLQRIEDYAQDEADFWKTPQLLQTMAEDGRNFALMNR